MTTTNNAPAPAPSGRGVQVKPLEWRSGQHDTYHADPDLIFCGYVTVRTGERVTWRPSESDEWREAATLDEAKAAAQADYEARILSALASDASPRGGAFQQRVQPWMLACFGEEISRDVVERNHRFLEEALELVQSTGCTASEAHQLVDYVFGREIGETHQEIGGVMVTLAALCLALGEDMHAAGETELARVWTKVEKIRAKQAAKPKHSPLPQHVYAHPAPATAESGDAKTLAKALRWFLKYPEFVPSPEYFDEMLADIRAARPIVATLAPATEGRKG